MKPKESRDVLFIMPLLMEKFILSALIMQARISESKLKNSSQEKLIMDNSVDYVTSFQNYTDRKFCRKCVIMSEK